jgi:hypothetical protein
VYPHVKSFILEHNKGQGTTKAATAKPKAVAKKATPVAKKAGPVAAKVSPAVQKAKPVSKKAATTPAAKKAAVAQK